MKIFREKQQDRPKPRLTMADVRRPGHRAAQARAEDKKGYFSRSGWRSDGKVVIKRRFGFIKFAFSFILISVIGSGLLYSGYIWLHKEEAMGYISGVYEGFKSVKDQLLNFKTEAASESLGQINSDLESLSGFAKFLKAAPVLNTVPETISKVKELVGKIADLNNMVSELKGSGAKLFFKDGNGRILEIMREAKTTIDDVRTIAGDLRNTAAGLNLDPALYGAEDYLVFDSSLDRLGGILSSLIALLEKATPTHFAVMLENPSEIRPGGGFTGSYIDLILENGEISAIEVNDIYYPKHFSSFKTVPPLQLQSISTNWDVQDANWFLDFPTSARKFIGTLEKSDIYADPGIKFEGVVAVNVRVMEDILRIIGDIEIPEYKMTLSSSNFLREVQVEVETGRDKQPGKNPKKVLKFIAPIVVERVKALSDEKKEQIFNMLANRFKNKDIKFYFVDMGLQSLLVQYGGAGDIFDVPAGFVGDYLAVVNANIAGGKSDQYIAQSIQVDSVIDASGMVTDNLVVKRAHSGQDQKEWWYRAVNQNYIKIFTLPRARIAYAKGGGVKIIKPPVDYKTKGYAVDPDLSTIESTLQELPEFNFQRYEEFGKSVFGTWFNVTAGKSKNLELSYSNSRELVLTSGLKYTFVLDKQSGVESDFKYSIQSPEGFIWDESNSQVFTYETKDLPSRLMIELTLEKDPSAASPPSVNQ